MLICPVCQQELLFEGSRAVCPKGHSFDCARQGYVNLLTDSSQKGHGDDVEMLRSRRRFLDAGHYEMLARKVAEEAASHFPPEGVLLDVGCGEGYYTKWVAEALEAQNKIARVFAFDIAKDAVRFTATRMEKKGQFFVASTFHIPMASSSVDLVMSLFAPYSENEFLRVLRPGGILLRAVPLEDHLYELKCAIYDEPKKNESAAVIGEGFRLLSETRIRGEICLQNHEEITALFRMTPYAHKTGREDQKKLEALENLTTQVDFGILLYEKIF